MKVDLMPELPSSARFLALDLSTWLFQPEVLALETVDKAMADRVLKNLIPMRARMVHDLAGNEISQNYGLYGEAINSIDRADLNCNLLDELDASANIETFFNHKLVRATFKPSVKLTFSVTQPMENDKFSNILEVDDVDLLVGCDGAHSVVRSQLQKVVRMDLNQEYIDHAYMELRINRIHDELNEENKFKMDKNHLHIWPRGSHMLIALPNTHGSFTSTLFAPWKIIENLDTDEGFDFFWHDFPDVFEKGLMTKEDILKAFHENPRGISIVSSAVLTTLKTSVSSLVMLPTQWFPFTVKV